jgi:hypothetical protein
MGSYTYWTSWNSYSNDVTIQKTIQFNIYLHHIPYKKNQKRWAPSRVYFSVRSNVQCVCILLNNISV